MGQFSVTIYGATGSVLSDIQHFRLALEQEEARDAADTPCPDTRRAQEDAERAKTVDLRKARMPARWQT